MGAGILPTCIYKGKLYFLFGKEHDYCDTPGWSDFGGGTDGSETFMQTAIREGGEELTGFLGSDAELAKMMKKHGTYNIDYASNDGHSVYRAHIFPLKYDPMLAIYYNNNQQFIQSHLDPDVIKKSKIFEKAEIRWVCVDDILKMRPQFRSYFQNIIDIIYEEKSDINNFIRTSLREKKHKTLKRRYKK